MFVLPGRHVEISRRDFSLIIFEEGNHFFFVSVCFSILSFCRARFLTHFSGWYCNMRGFPLRDKTKDLLEYTPSSFFLIPDDSGVIQEAQQLMRNKELPKVDVAMV